MGEHVAEQDVAVRGAAFACSADCRAKFFVADQPRALERVPADDLVQRCGFFEPQLVAEVEGGRADPRRSTTRGTDGAALPADQLVLDGGEAGFVDDAGGVFHQFLTKFTLDAEFELGRVSGAGPSEYGLEGLDAQAGQRIRRVCAQDHAGVVAGGRDVLFEPDVSELLELGDTGVGDDGAAADGTVCDCVAFASVVVLDGEQEALASEMAPGCDVGDGDAVAEGAGNGGGREHFFPGLPQYLSRY